MKSGTNGADLHYDGAGHLIAESNGTGVFRRQYLWLDDLPVAYYQAGSLFFVHTDHLGAPQKMTDGSQNIVWDGAASDPFMAQPLPTNLTMNLRLPGQQYDALTGLHYNGMRDYDPTLGRYLESDPIGLAGGINTYGYAGGNPVRFTDPTGLQEEELFPDPDLERELEQNRERMLENIAPRPNPAPPACTPENPSGGSVFRSPSVLRGDGPPASSFSGSQRSPLQAPNGPPRNPPGEFNGVPYTGHAFDQLQNRGIPPSAVDQALQSGIQSPGNEPGTVQSYDPINNLTVVTDQATGNVITVRKGP